MPNINTWHHRGGFADNARVIYAPDENGNVSPVVIGQDAYGNDVVITEDSPWYANLLQQGIQTTGQIFGGGFNRRNDAPAAAVSATVSPTGGGVGLGLSSNTLLLLGVVAAVFLLGKGRR
jgi:hypothetical protein